MLPDNLGDLFDTACALTPSKPARFQGDTVLTYAELDGRANQAANALAALGVTAGDRVALLFNNDFGFLEMLFGAMRLGAVAVPLNIRVGDETLRYVAEDSEAAVLVANAAVAERARMLAAQIPAIKHVIADGPAADGVLAYESVLAAAAPTLARGAQYGREQLFEIARKVIIDVARAQGKELAGRVGGDSLTHFASALEDWKKGFSFFDQFMIVIAVWVPYLATARLRARLLPPRGLSRASQAHFICRLSHVSPQCLAQSALFETRATSSSSLESNSFRTGD